MSSHILDVLRGVAPIINFTVWPGLDACDAELSTPPVLWWTYGELPEDLALLLRHAVATFKGTIEWQIVVTGRRWLLMPSRIREYAEEHGCNGDLIAAAELKVADPGFGKRANAELKLLAEHIRYRLKMADMENRGV